MREWKSCEVSKGLADELRVFLKGNEIKYEPSSCYNLIHFEMLVDNLETNLVNQYLKSKNL